MPENYDEKGLLRIINQQINPRRQIDSIDDFFKHYADDDFYAGSFGTVLELAKFPLEYFEKYFDKLGKRNYSRTLAKQDLTEAFIENHLSYFNNAWNALSNNQKFSDDFIRRHSAKIELINYFLHNPKSVDNDDVIFLNWMNSIPDSEVPQRVKDGWKRKREEFKKEHPVIASAERPQTGSAEKPAAASDRPVVAAIYGDAENMTIKQLQLELAAKEEKIQELEKENKRLNGILENANSNYVALLTLAQKNIEDLKTVNR